MRETTKRTDPDLPFGRLIVRRHRFRPEDPLIWDIFTLLSYLYLLVNSNEYEGYGRGEL
jgi:hypothetical protein